MKRFFILFFLIIGVGLSAQDGLVDLTKNFAFRDGIYLSFESFKNNIPDVSWEKLKLDAYTNPQTLMTQVTQIQTDTGAFNLNTTWGLCIDGTPAIRIKDTLSALTTHYAALLWRGKICYYYYEKDIEKNVEVSAYNPLTGKPFRTAFVKRKIPEIFEKMLDWETGKQAAFNVATFKEWIADDEDMLDKVSKMSDASADEALLDLLKEYTDRNVVFVRE